MGSLLASCAYNCCNCCVCECCFKMYKQDEMFQKDLGLVVYDKMFKTHSINPVYDIRDTIFKELQILLNNNRIQNDQNDVVDEDIVIADIGCHTGLYTKIICDTFISNKKDKLLCIDSSPKCLQFVENKIVKKNQNLQKYNISYINNNINSLCLPDDYNNQNIDLCFMSLSMYQMPIINKSRDLILKEIYKSLKKNAIYVVIEYSSEFYNDLLIQNQQKIKKKGGYNKVQDNQNDDYDDNDDLGLFESVDDLKKYVEGFGFKFVKTIEHLYDNQQFVTIFRK